jgi:hypothetical protein
MADSPAFYDATSSSIYVVADASAEFRQFSIERALTLALLDQHFGWSGRVAAAPPAAARGTRALYDADAMAVALSLVDSTERPKILDQLFGIYAAYKIPTTPSPFATAVAGRLGLADWPYLDMLPTAQRDALETDATFTDGQVLDLRRLTSATVEVARGQSEGALFWYHALASRIDDDLAWKAALAWRADDVSTANGSTGLCVAAAFQPAEGADKVVMSAFDQWAAAAPKQSLTQVKLVARAGGASQVTISACDPGASVLSNDGKPRLSLGGAPLRAEQFRRLSTSQPQLAADQAACSVYGSDPVTLADERGMVDGVKGWKAPDAHPAPNPSAPGCPAK